MSAKPVAIDRAVSRFAEIMYLFESEQEHASDNIPSCPEREDFDAVHPAIRNEMLGYHKRAADAERKASDQHLETLTCKACGRKFVVEHGKRGKPRKHHTDACRKKIERCGDA